KVGRLRADVYVYAADMEQIRQRERAVEGFAHFGRGDAKLRREQRRLQAYVRARADLRHEAQGDIGAFVLPARGGGGEIDLVDRVHIDREDAGADGFVQLFVGLARAVEDDLFG